MQLQLEWGWLFFDQHDALEITEFSIPNHLGRYDYVNPFLHQLTFIWLYLLWIMGLYLLFSYVGTVHYLLISFLNAINQLQSHLTQNSNS